MALKENYVDDILDTSKNTKRKYNMITNADGTVSFEDVTEYSQNGDSFGANDVNAITERVNRSLTGDDVVDNLGSTDSTAPLSANMGMHLNKKIERRYIGIGVNQEYVSVITKNVLRIVNNILYADVFINIFKEIPENDPVIAFDDGTLPIFIDRCDIVLVGIQNGVEGINRLITALNGECEFIANGRSIPAGFYHLKVTVDLDKS